ncbi:MAG TPA: response regulator transcription factor [Gemmataceae bacterium]|nr:response regulator transcription factor [Gemmataceae bacterium]
MRQVPPDTRFLLLGLPESHAASVAHGLRTAGANVDVACRDPYSPWFERIKPYDVILVMLAARSALDLADLVFYRQRAAEAGILAVAPVRDARQIAYVLDGGADDCVTIPFEGEELLARLCTLARRVRACCPRESVIRTYDLEIDLGKRRVRRGHQVIPLTRREYALLELLARHRGRIVSRNLIREHVYGGAEEMASNVIDVYIRYLRTKVDRGFDLPLILTRWGQGYVLRDDANGQSIEKSSPKPEA